MSYNEDNAKLLGIVIDDLRKVRAYFDEHGLDKSKMVFRYNEDLNRWEVLSCTSGDYIIRLIYDQNTWWEEP